MNYKKEYTQSDIDISKRYKVIKEKFKEIDVEIIDFVVDSINMTLKLLDKSFYRKFIIHDYNNIPIDKLENSIVNYARSSEILQINSSPNINLVKDSFRLSSNENYTKFYFVYKNSKDSYTFTVNENKYSVGLSDYNNLSIKSLKSLHFNVFKYGSLDRTKYKTQLGIDQAEIVISIFNNNDLYLKEVLFDSYHLFNFLTLNANSASDTSYINTTTISHYMMTVSEFKKVLNQASKLKRVQLNSYFGIYEESKQDLFISSVKKLLENIPTDNNKQGIFIRSESHILKYKREKFEGDK